nr:uncharacterized protein LOC127345241 [Lolium perenne]
MRARPSPRPPTRTPALASPRATAWLTATAPKVFDEMARGGIGMNTHVYNAMLHMCLRAGRADALMTRMDAAGMSAGPLLVQHPDRALRQEGDAVRGGSEWRGVKLDEAKEALFEMLGAGF